MPLKRAPQKSWILYGPQGCGKSRHADKIARTLGLRRILDHWMPGQRVPLTDTLVITHAQPSAKDLARMRRLISFDDAMKRVRAHQSSQANRDPANVRRRPTTPRHTPAPTRGSHA